MASSRPPFLYWQVNGAMVHGITTLSGLPATVPIGRSSDGLPIGAQIVGGYLEDRTTIAFAEMIEREFGGFTPPPI